MTYHRDSAVASMEHALATIDNAGRHLSEVLRRMRANDLLDQDVIVQHDPRQAFDLTDAFCYTDLRRLMMSGSVFKARLHVGDTPWPNSCVLQNQAILDRIPSPFRARYNPERGGGAECDGRLWWNKPVRLCKADIRTEPRFSIVEVAEQCGDLPLEVGTTTASRSWMHIHKSSGLARWPYGSEWIHVFWTPVPLYATAMAESLKAAYEKAVATESASPAASPKPKKKAPRPARTC